jgi:alpha-methylacyl-CoA racemase
MSEDGLQRDALPGPLHGVRVLDIGGIGPGPFAGLVLADMGADVVRVDRPGGTAIFPGSPSLDVLNRGKRSVCLDLKHPGAVEALLTLAAGSDIVIEGHRPGVAERLGFGPEKCRESNAPLVYGRMTGWGQDGPLAQRAGHDISYIALTGALHAIGPAGGSPQIPLNLVGDFGGGGTYLVMGVLAALLEARLTGVGRTVDAAIVDGTAHLLAGTHGLMNTGTWEDDRGVNMFDGGAPYYAVYETADGGHMAVGAIEPPFYAALLAVLEVRDVDPARQNDRSTWPHTRQVFARAFASRTRAEWTALFAPTDACTAPVLSLREAADDPHLRHRGTVVDRDGFIQPAPAPRFSGTETAVSSPPPEPGQHTRQVLESAGVDAERLIRDRAAHQAG